MKTQLEKNRPRNYQPIKELESTIASLNRLSIFKLTTIDGRKTAAFVKYENKTLYYTSLLKAIRENKIPAPQKVLLHRIIAIQKTW